MLTVRNEGILSTRLLILVLMVHRQYDSRATTVLSALYHKPTLTITSLANGKTLDVESTIIVVVLLLSILTLLR